MNIIFKKVILKIFPNPVLKWLGDIYFNFRLKQVQLSHKNALIRVRKKEKITVVFLLIHEPVWKYEGVYKLMEHYLRFNPIVVVCPDIVYGKESTLKDMNWTYENFKKKGYNVKKSFNEITSIWLDVKKELKPDIIFFTNPHNITRKEYSISNYLDTLTCYVQYSFHITYLHELQYNQFFHNVLWYAFYETPIHVQYAKEYTRNKEINVEYTGYPGTDIFQDRFHKPKDLWKIKDSTFIRIIWAPHHTIQGLGVTLDFSNFMDMAYEILNLLSEKSNEIQIAFKPHPLLRSKLENEEYWGKDKTKEYFDHWESIPNGQLFESNYEDLFLTSDALIHDSASFMTEYLYTKKPVLFISKDSNITDRLNDFGKMVFKLHYNANNIYDIKNFIDNVIIAGNDYKLLDRIKFLEEVLLPPNGISASQNIMNILNKNLQP